MYWGNSTTIELTGCMPRRSLPNLVRLRRVRLDKKILFEGNMNDGMSDY